MLVLLGPNLAWPEMSSSVSFHIVSPVKMVDYLVSWLFFASTCCHHWPTLTGKCEYLKTTSSPNAFFFLRNIYSTNPALTCSSFSSSCILWLSSLNSRQRFLSSVVSSWTQVWDWANMDSCACSLTHSTKTRACQKLSINEGIRMTGNYKMLIHLLNQRCLLF